VAATVVYAIDQLGLLDRLADGALDVTGFAIETGADAALVTELVRIARMFGYVTGPEVALRLTDVGRAMADMRGYFTWVVGGYSGVLADAARLASGAERYGEQIRRDDAMVGRGSGQNDRSFLAGLLDEALLDVEFESIADLGSGICGRLCRLLGARPGSRGVGIDVSEEATALAGGEITRAGLADRVAAVQCDVMRLLFDEPSRDPAVCDVDTVTSFFLLHDLLADAGRRKEVIPRMREAFPKARTFVLADTVLRPEGGAQLPIFSAGFELAHALMGVPLHTRQAYEQLFAAAGLQVRLVVPFGTPHSWLYVLDAA
jgi:hypothetical protein